MVAMSIKVKLQKCFYVFQFLLSRKPAAGVFLFHTIESNPSIWTAGYRYITPLKVFQEQIRYIQEHFVIISTHELVDCLQKKSLTKHVAAIHFDDGFTSYRDEALPFLKARSIPSTVFLVGSVLRGDIPLRNKIAFCLNAGFHEEMLDVLESVLPSSEERSQIRQMSKQQVLAWIKNQESPEMEKAIRAFFEKKRDPINYPSPFLSLSDIASLKKESLVTIGSHTTHHSLLSLLSEKEQKEEIVQGHLCLEQYLGTKLSFFAYPHGGEHHFNDVSRRLTLSLPEVTAFSSYGGINFTYDRSDVRRIALTDHLPKDIRIAVLKGAAKGYEDHR